MSEQEGVPLATASPFRVERTAKSVSFADHITDWDDVQFVNSVRCKPPLESQPTLGEDEYSDYDELAVQNRCRGRQVPPHARGRMRPKAPVGKRAPLTGAGGSPLGYPGSTFSVTAVTRYIYGIFNDCSVLREEKGNAKIFVFYF